MSSSFRIAVLTTSFPRFIGDEATLFLGRLIDALSEAGHSGHLFVPFDEKEKEEDRRGSFAIHRSKYGLITRGKLAFGNGILPNLRRNPLLILQAPMLLLQLFRSALKYKDEFDIIHGHWIVTSIPAYFLSVASGKPFVLTVRGEDIKLLRTPLRLFFSFFLNKASHISTVSDEFLRELKETLPNLRPEISVTPNGITRFERNESESESVRKEHSLPQSGEILLYVGRVVPLKQPELLIEALSLTAETFPDTSLVLAGRVSDEYRKELLTLAEKLNVRERVSIPGALTPTEIGGLLTTAKLYMSASTHEGRSNAVLEALASGLPPCISDIPGHRELVKHNDNGMLFATDSAKEASEVAISLLSSDERWNERSSRAVASVSHLTWKECEKTYSRCFSSILGA